MFLVSCAIWNFFSSAVGLRTLNYILAMEVSKQRFICLHIGWLYILLLWKCSTHTHSISVSLCPIDWNIFSIHMWQNAQFSSHLIRYCNFIACVIQRRERNLKGWGKKIKHEYRYLKSSHTRTHPYTQICMNAVETSSPLVSDFDSAYWRIWNVWAYGFIWYSASLFCPNVDHSRLISVAIPFVQKLNYWESNWISFSFFFGSFFHHFFIDDCGQIHPTSIAFSSCFFSLPKLYCCCYCFWFSVCLCVCVQ